MNSQFLIPILLTFTTVWNFIEARADEGFKNDSGVGIVLTTGNAPTQSLNLAQTNHYGWGKNLVTFNSKYLNNSANGVRTALRWNLGLRYDRALIEQRMTAFAAEGLESDIFAGYNQRYNTDLGSKVFLFKSDVFDWSSELGYRYSIENRNAGQVNLSFARVYSEAVRKFSPTVSMKLTAEFLQNFTETNDRQINSELSLSAALTEVFSVKTGYLVRYRSFLPPPATKNTDTQFTTALVAKF